MPTCSMSLEKYLRFDPHTSCLCISDPTSNLDSMLPPHTHTHLLIHPSIPCTSIHLHPSPSIRPPICPFTPPSIIRPSFRQFIRPFVCLFSNHPSIRPSRPSPRALRAGGRHPHPPRHRAILLHADRRDAHERRGSHLEASRRHPLTKALFCLVYNSTHRGGRGIGRKRVTRKCV